MWASSLQEHSGSAYTGAWVSSSGLVGRLSERPQKLLRFHLCQDGSRLQPESKPSCVTRSVGFTAAEASRPYGQPPGFDSHLLSSALA